MTHIPLMISTLAAGVALCIPLAAKTSAMWRWFGTTQPPFVLASVASEVANHHTTVNALDMAVEDNTKPPPRPSRKRQAFVGALVVLIVCLLVGGGLLIAAQPAAQPVQAYLYVNPGHEVVFLQVQGALTSTTGTWLEADRTARGVLRHQWTAQYAANDRTVHILLSTGDVVTGQIDNAQYSAMDLTLPVNAVGIFPPLAHFVAATPGDWNSAYTSLMASAGVTP